MALQFTYLFLSFAILYLGANLSLGASEHLGKKIGLSPFVIGMLLVGFGTSLPEFFVSQISSFRGEGEIALGNIIGSNIANVFLILGIAGLLTPIPIRIKGQLPQLRLYLLSSIILAILFIFNKYTIWSSIPLIAIFIYFLFLISKDRKNNIEKEEEDKEQEKISTLPLIFKFILGIISLYIGGELLVSSGKTICLSLGISTYIISAILVAFGTSVPELATTIILIIKKKDSGYILGNIIGSNIFNTTFVLGSIGAYNLSLTRNYYPEIFLIIFSSLIFLLFYRLKIKFKKLMAILFLTIYSGLIYYWLIK